MIGECHVGLAVWYHDDVDGEGDDHRGENMITNLTRPPDPVLTATLHDHFTISLVEIVPHLEVFIVRVDRVDNLGADLEPNLVTEVLSDRVNPARLRSKMQEFRLM